MANHSGERVTEAIGFFSGSAESAAPQPFIVRFPLSSPVMQEAKRTCLQRTVDKGLKAEMDDLVTIVYNLSTDLQNTDPTATLKTLSRCRQRLVIMRTNGSEGFVTQHQASLVRLHEVISSSATALLLRKSTAF